MNLDQCFKKEEKIATHLIELLSIDIKMLKILNSYEIIQYSKLRSAKRPRGGRSVLDLGLSNFGCNN